MIWNLFAVDGKIPFVQIAIGVVIGVLGMYLYSTYMKEKMMGKKETLVPVAPKPARKISAPEKMPGAPVLLDVNRQFRPGRNTLGMPRLPIVQEHESSSDDSSSEDDESSGEEEEDEEEEEEDTLDNERGILVMPSGGALGTIDDT
jgi:hypothetical protein